MIASKLVRILNGSCTCCDSHACTQRAHCTIPINSTALCCLNTLCMCVSYTAISNSDCNDATAREEQICKRKKKVGYWSVTHHICTRHNSSNVSSALFSSTLANLRNPSCAQSSCNVCPYLQRLYALWQSVDGLLEGVQQSCHCCIELGSCMIVGKWLPK
jgi:hypothetical protein